METAVAGFLEAFVFRLSNNNPFTHAGWAVCFHKGLGL